MSPRGGADAVLLAVVLALATEAVVKAELGDAGPYLTVTERAWDCAEGELGFDGSTTHHLRYERYNPFERRKVLATFGNVTMRLPYNDSYWENMTMAIWSNNQWKSNSLLAHVPDKACSVYRDSKPEVYYHMTRALPNTTACLIPAGTYYFRGERMSRNIRRARQMPYGLYRKLVTGGLAGRQGLTLCIYSIVRVLEDVRPPT